jgi:hypothetical protein
MHFRAGDPAMNCYNCGAQNSDDMPFCPKCGSSWGWKCSCKNINQIEAKFCSRCGSPHLESTPKITKASLSDSETTTDILAANTESGAPVADKEIFFNPNTTPPLTSAVEQLSAEQIEQLIAESSSMSLADKEVITQEDIDRLFEDVF